jgi:hypothetical protein
MIQDQTTDPSVPATTTHQQDMTAAGQRRVNLIWEYTQAAISISVVLANMIVGIYSGMAATSPPFPVVLSSSLFLIVGFYFSRTNHAAVGGVGKKPQTEYTGR